MTPLISNEEIKNSDEFFQRIHQVQVDYLSYWKVNTLWHWEFWLSVALSTIPWVIWILLRKRGSEARLLLAGGFGLIVSAWFDFLGLVLGFWHYAGRVLPTIPTFLPWDFTLIPVTIMLWLQFKPALNPFFKAVIYSALTSFIGEPLFEWIGFYTTVKWSVFYSFPIYVIIYLIAYRISRAKSLDPL
ncbi:CBO0543 family protein [Bacillus sp. FJAT-29814]|uniref:CBO0543 family protein n=1 Tax=Bacillus sp. FJAT-29814 TaxID=1729688 RepID=UPI0008311DD8|nr:CBO0543 family protein [Bacillus sp. FJAT-29814]